MEEASREKREIRKPGKELRIADLKEHGIGAGIGKRDKSFLSPRRQAVCTLVGSIADWAGVGDFLIADLKGRGIGLGKGIRIFIATTRSGLYAGWECARFGEVGVWTGWVGGSRAHWLLWLLWLLCDFRGEMGSVCFIGPFGFFNFFSCR